MKSSSSIRSAGSLQIRNSNTISLAAQVALAGGEPVMLGQRRTSTTICARIWRRRSSRTLCSLSGGVSVGKYDLVEQVLRDMEAEFFFDGWLRPGKPAVFGWCKGKPVFGLPGNPVSTMVTFELFVVPAIDLLSGHAAGPLPCLKRSFRMPSTKRPACAHFLPARVSWPDRVPTVEAILWEGSGDIGAVVRGNCFLVVHESKLKYAAGEMA